MSLRFPGLPRSRNGEWRLTGRMVLAMLVAFFGLVMIVNVVMVRAALSTFGGVDTPSSYKAGLAYKAEEAAADAQNALGWDVSAHLTAAGEGAEIVTVDVLDGSGRPAVDIVVAARLAHPIDERRDVALAMEEIGPGTFSATGVVAPGQWVLDIAIFRGEERLFRSLNRVAVP